MGWKWKERLLKLSDIFNCTLTSFIKGRIWKDSFMKNQNSTITQLFCIKQGVLYGVLIPTAFLFLFLFFFENTRSTLNISNSPLERSTFKTALVLKKYDCHLELPRDRFQTLILILSKFKQINFHNLSLLLTLHLFLLTEFQPT